MWDAFVEFYEALMWAAHSDAATGLFLIALGVSTLTTVLGLLDTATTRVIDWVNRGREVGDV